MNNSLTPNMNSGTSITNDGFKKSLEKFRQNLSDEQKHEFSMSSHDDIKLAIIQIQKKIGPDKKLRGITRIRKFLEGMKQVEELVKVFINVHEVVAFVWGPIKLALMLAATNVDTLDLLLTAYQDIGEFLHGLKKFDRLFRNYPEIQEILETYFFNVLEFHAAVLEVFKEKDWKRFFRNAWPTFRTKFGPIIENLKRHRALLDDEKMTVLLEEVQESRESLEGGLQQLSDDLKTELDKLKNDIIAQVVQSGGHTQSTMETQKLAVIAKLKPPNYQIHHKSAAKQRHSNSAGDWIFQEPVFKKWLASDRIGLVNQTPQDPSNDSLLYLHGIPGSGKTTLASKIIDQIQVERQVIGGILLFFYFKHSIQDSDYRTKSGLLRALVSQMAEQDIDLLEHIHQETSSTTDSAVRTDDNIETLTKSCFGRLDPHTRVWIVLDGLDECNDYKSTSNCNGSSLSSDTLKKDEESRHVIEFLNELLAMDTNKFNNIRVLVSAQRDGFIDEMLFRYPDIDLGKSHRHFNDIEAFVEAKISDIRKRFRRLDLSYEMKIRDQILHNSKGMFLYAKVVLDNLRDQDSLADLKRELDTEAFPEDLDAAYERVSVRVFDRAKQKRKNSTALLIVGWVMTAGRPLRWREIQSRFCIDLDQELCDPDNQRVESCKTICGSLVDVEPCELFRDSESEQLVRIVHETASRYMQRSGRIKAYEEHSQTLNFIYRYLHSAPLSDPFDIERIQGIALTGYYGLLDYSLAFWGYHAQAVIESGRTPRQDLKEEALLAIKILLAESEPQLTSLSSVINSVDAAGELSGLQPTENETLECSPDHAENIRLAFGAQINQSIQGSVLERRCAGLRELIELMDQRTLESDIRQIFEELQGCKRFKCPHVRCSKFSAGFLTATERNQHMKAHERPFKCLEVGCYGGVIGYCSEKDLEKHKNRLHVSSTDLGFALHFSKTSQQNDYTIYDAARRGDLTGLEAFRRMGIDLTKAPSSRSLKTPLKLAARGGHAHICRYILSSELYSLPESQVDTDQIGYVWPAIQEAIFRHDVETYRTLRYTNLEYYSRRANSRLEIAWAISAGSAEMVDEALVGVGTQIWNHGFLDDIINNCKLKNLIKRHRDYFPRPEDWASRLFLLHRVVRSIFPDIYLSDQIPTVEPVCSSIAASQQLSQLTKAFDRSSRGLLGQACKEKCLFLLDFMARTSTRDTFAHVDPDGSNFFHAVAYWSDGSSLRNLPENAIDIILNVADRILTKCNASVEVGNLFDRKRNDGELPLHIASRAKTMPSSIFSFLVDHTSDLECLNFTGLSPLRLAIEALNVSGVRGLLKSKRLSPAHILYMSDLAAKFLKEYEQKWGSSASGLGVRKQIAEILESMSSDIQASEPRSLSISSDNSNNEHAHGDINGAALPGLREDEEILLTDILLSMSSQVD